jgi:hypothetical protein
MKLSFVSLGVLASNVYSVSSQVTIAMKPFDGAEQLSQIVGRYFEPVDSTDKVCHGDVIPRDCDGTLEIDLTSGVKSILQFDWVASDVPHEKYLSLGIDSTSTGKVQFEFSATSECSDTESTGISQEIEAADIDYTFDFIPGADASYMYDVADSFIEFEGCQIFSRMTFNVTGTAAGLNLDFAKFSFSAAYDSSNVVQGNQVYTWSTSKFNWIQFEGVTDLAADLITNTVKDAPMYLSASPSSSPSTESPTSTESESPSTSPIAQASNPNPNNLTNGSGYLSLHVISSVFLLLVTVAFV